MKFDDDPFDPRGSRDTTLKHKKNHTGADNPVFNFRNWTEIHDTLGITDKITHKWTEAVGAWFAVNLEHVVEDLRTIHEQKKVEPLYGHLYGKFLKDVDVANDTTNRLYISALRFAVLRWFYNKKRRDRDRMRKRDKSPSAVGTYSPHEAMRSAADASLMLDANFEPPNGKRCLCNIKEILEDGTPQTNTAGSGVSLEKWHDLLKRDMGYTAEFDITCPEVFGGPLSIIEGRHLGAALSACETGLAKFVLTPVKRNSGMFR